MVETLIVNGVSAWQMMYRNAHVQTGQTILVHGANGGVGTVLVQLALHAGVRVIGTAAPRNHDALRTLGVEPVDYGDKNWAARVQALSPNGVDAVFDHLGIESAKLSFGLLARGGTLVAYGMATQLKVKETTSMVALFMKFLVQITLWNALPNTRHATFYNFWGGRSINPIGFRRRFREDLTAILELLAQGAISPQIAARFPLTQIVAAMELAESRTVTGKVVLIP